MAADDEQARRIATEARLFDTATQAVIGTTLDGVIVFWNRAAREIYGWQESEVLGRDVLEVTPSTISREVAAKIMSQLRSGRGWSGVFNVRGRDGEAFTTRVRDLPVHDDSGELIGIIGISEPAPSDE